MSRKKRKENSTPLEIGIDLYWDKTYLLEQQIAFRKQILSKKQYKLPWFIVGLLMKYLKY
jgi:Tat protein secretion system quality control protein TatD with DNase activity